VSLKAHHLVILTSTSVVARAISPSVNRIFFFFTFSELKISKFSNVDTLKAQLLFPSKPIFFAIFLNFQQYNSLKNQYLSHLSSENCEINSIKSDSPRGFQ